MVEDIGLLMITHILLWIPKHNILQFKKSITSLCKYKCFSIIYLFMVQRRATTQTTLELYGEKGPIKITKKQLPTKHDIQGIGYKSS